MRRKSEKPDTPQVPRQYSPEELLGMSPEELYASGYERLIIETPHGPVTRIVDKENLEKERNRSEQRKKQEPFGAIEMKVPLAERAFRPLTDQDVIRYFNAIQCYDGRMTFDDIYNDNAPACVFRKHCMEFFVSSSKNVTVGLEESLFEDLSIYAFGSLIFEWQQEMYAAMDRRTDYTGALSGKDAESLADDLERIKGKFGDKAYWKRELARERLRSLRAEYEETAWFQGNAEHLSDMNREQHALSLLIGYANDIFGKDVFGRCRSLEELRTTLETSALGAYLPSVEREKALRERIKSADAEERKVLSGQMKAVGEKRKLEQQILKGVIQWIAIDEYGADALVRKINEMQSSLAAASGSEKNTETTLFLDGRYDPKLDANPGKVSGDCTENRPLPFGEPGIPLHNIKCFNQEKKHIGNIYLLETSCEESQEKVWHLDAIQIPSRILWDKAIKTLIGNIGAEAKKKGIRTITVNRRLEHISNYSYISDAVEKYNRENGLGTMEIRMPDEKYWPEEEHSRLQGNGEVLIIAKL